MSSLVGAQEEKLEKLRSYAWRGKWPEVFEMYKQERALRTAMITATGDTVLHMAVSNGEEKVVANMVDFLVQEEKCLAQNNLVVIVDGDNKESSNVEIILGAENDRKNTPLHVAASMGKVQMCKKLGGANPSLIARRNIAGETPLFLAALYGKKEAFLCLHYQYMSHPGVSSTDLAHCVRDNGDTILHCTIAEGHFDVGIEIVHLYKDHLKEMMMRNKEGLSPLHLLAANRSAFKSTALLVQPIYWGCLYQMRQIKKRHTWSLQIMNKLLQHASDEDLSRIISRTATEQLSISLQTEEDNGRWWIESKSMVIPLSGTIIIETTLMIAVKNGVMEMVEKILELFPSIIKDVNSEGKNIVLLAVEYRQTEVFKFLCKQKWLSESLFWQVDKEENNALHLAARLGVEPDWLNPRETLSMSREINWFEFVKISIPRGLSERYNKKMETPEDIFRESHKGLMKIEGEWAAKTSQACSVVSTLVASVAYATRTNVPGGYDEKGYAILRNNPPIFRTFVDSSFAALLFSLLSTIFFLSIAASRSQSVHSWRSVPFRLYLGMYFMFGSIICLWISFCVGDFFMLDDDNQKLHMALPRYIVSTVVVILLVFTQLPTFLGPTLSSMSRIPTPRCKATRPIEYRRNKNKENGTDLSHEN